MAGNPLAAILIFIRFRFSKWLAALLGVPTTAVPCAPYAVGFSNALDAAFSNALDAAFSKALSVSFGATSFPLSFTLFLKGRHIFCP